MLEGGWRAGVVGGGEGEGGGRGREGIPSIVGSYSSTKCAWISWMVRQDLPTPPPPTTTSLYSRRNWVARRGGRMLERVVLWGGWLE